MYRIQQFLPGYWPILFGFGIKPSKFDGVLYICPKVCRTIPGTTGGFGIRLGLALVGVSLQKSPCFQIFNAAHVERFNNLCFGYHGSFGRDRLFCHSTTVAKPHRAYHLIQNTRYVILMPMSGHSKWSKVKHKKAASDAKKSKEFSKLVRLIKVEARKAGGDTESPGLKTVIEKAKATNMPKDNIERAVRGASEAGGADYESVTYEAYGPGGAALIIETLTDNRNRTSAEIKHIFAKRGLAIAAPGAASWAFAKDERGEWQPKQTLTLNDSDRASVDELIEELENNDDVQTVWTNAEV